MMMLSSLARQICCRNSSQRVLQIRSGHFVTMKNKVGVSLIRHMEKEDQEEEECPFPAFKSLDVTTQDRIHKFSAPCDRVIKFIKLGAINKTIALQYCHYLAHLTRTSSTNEDKEYYSARCVDLMLYLIRHGKDMPTLSKSKLLSDIADTSEENCRAICQQAHDQLDSFSPHDLTALLATCYKFGLWEQAQAIMTKDEKLKAINLRLIEPFVVGVIGAAEKFKTLDKDSSDRAKLRANVLEHMYEILNRSAQNRQQFVTKSKKQFIEALYDLELKVVINPTIKMSGRCTSCNSHLPLFDSRHTAIINQATKQMLHHGAEKGLYLNCSPADVSRFESFLRELYDVDRKPIDIVIDGLNVAYRHSVGIHYIKKQLTEDVQTSKRVRSPEGQTQVLVNAIIRGDMLTQFKKIVVVGKHHMTRWPGLMQFFKKNKIHFYSSFNNSKDDLFQIYASTLNPKTLLVTGDYFRDHLSQVSESDRILLERWLDTRQVWIDNRSLKPIWPTPYEKIPSVNSDKSCFHIPIIDFNLLLTASEHDPPPHLNNKFLTWICCSTSSSPANELSSTASNGP